MLNSALTARRLGRDRRRLAKALRSRAAHQAHLRVCPASQFSQLVSKSLAVRAKVDRAALERRSAPLGNFRRRPIAALSPSEGAENGRSPTRTHGRREMFPLPTPVSSARSRSPGFPSPNPRRKPPRSAPRIHRRSRPEYRTTFDRGCSLGIEQQLVDLAARRAPVRSQKRHGFPERRPAIS